MIPRLGHVHLPRLTGLCRWLGMFCGLAITSCTASNQPVVVVTVNGITSALVTESVKTTLGGKPSTNQLDVLRRGLEKFELRLAEDAQGTLGIAVSAQGSDGCTARAGSTSVDVSGPGSYEATIDLADSPGCLLVVRKEGDGAARVKLSDGTQWSFAPPDPPAAACPLELLAGSAQSKAFTVGSSVTVLAETSLDFAPNSYIADISGCTSGAGGCSLTIEPDPVQVTLRVGRNTACSNDQVCWEHPKPQGLHLRRIKGSNDNDIWASGDGTLLHWEGTYWSTPRRARVPNQYLGIVSSEVGSAVFVGSTGVVSRLESSIWSCLETKGTQDLRAAWGPTPNDFWAVGAKGTLVHWDGKAWSTSTIAGSTELWGIAGTGANNIWAVGDASTVLHYDGASWNKVPLGASMATTLSLRGVWVDPSGEVWIVGDSGISLSIRNGQTTAWATGTTATINDIFAIPGQHKWAVGDGGTLLRHDGQSWSAVESGTRENLNSLWGGSATSIWAVGNYGTQLRYNGVFWTVASSARKTQNLYALGTIPTASGQTGTLFGVGDQGTVMRNSGADWLLDAAINGMTTRTLRAASSTSTSIWLAGDAGTILNFNGTVAVMPSVGTAADFYGIWSTTGAAVAVGSGGVLARQNGSSWSAITLPAAGGRTLRGVYGSSATNLWIVGDGGLILRWNGTAATAAPSGVSDTLYSVSGSGATNLWAVGDRGRILHSDGTTWALDAAGSALTTSALYAATVTANGTVYAVGENGVLLRYSSQTWKALDSGTIAALRAVFVSSGGDVLFAGNGGSILRLRASQ